MNTKTRLVPWESWQIWNEVREGVFSPSPETALNKIAAWKSRGSLPISIEVTADLVNIQRRDPHFSNVCCPENLITGEMLQLMYSMVIMRLVNGVVDQSKRQNSSSVAERAEGAGLPRMLVDVRHEVAHKELPSLSVLQLASKKALEWLKIHYWEAQKQFLHDSFQSLKRKLYTYAAAQRFADGEQSRGRRKGGKDLNDLVKSVSAAVPDVVSILVDEGLVEKCITGDKMWQFVMEELIYRVPELSKELMSWCFNSGQRDILKTLQIFKFLVDNSSQKVWQSHEAGRLVEMSSKAQQLHMGLDGWKDTTGERQELLCTASDAEEAVETKLITDDGAIETNFERNGCVFSEAKKHLQILYEQKFGIRGMSIEHGGWKESGARGHGPSENVWTVTENWSPCAIGKLPSSYDFTGALPSYGSAVFTSGDDAPVCRKETSSQEELVGDAGAVQTVTDVELVGGTVTGGIDIEKDMSGIEKWNGKRGAADDSEEGEGMMKRFKEDLAGLSYEDGKEKNTNVAMRELKPVVDHHHNSAADKKSLVFGVLLLDGAYKSCTAAQLSAIQSTIHLLK